MKAQRLRFNLQIPLRIKVREHQGVANSASFRTLGNVCTLVLILVLIQKKSCA